MSWIQNIGHYSKAIVAGVGAVGVVLVTLAADPNVNSVVPQNIVQWAAAAGAVIVTVLGVFLKANTPKQQ